MKQFSIVILSVVFTCIGLAGGWFAAGQKPVSGHSHDDDDEAQPSPASHGHDHGAAKPKLSPQARQNLGITVAEINTQEYVRTKAVPAIVIESPTSSQPLFAPAGGTIISVEVQPGQIVAPGATVVRILRDPLPRPALTLTDAIIKPAREDFHDAIADIRRALRGVEILKSELERIRKFTETGTQDGLPVIPKKNEIDLRYDLARAEQELESARLKLRLHGLSDEQILQAESGQFAPGLNEQVWQRALKRNGLWNEKSEALFAALPSSMKEAAWSVAAIGELTGAGLASGELAAWLKEDQSAGDRFLEIAALLQQGMSLDQAKALHALNALNPVIEVRAPHVKDAPDWDAREIAVKRFEKVAAGTKLGTLANPRQMLLKSEPVGGEVSVILNALKDNTEIEATPLVEGSGPALKGLKLLNVSTDDQTRATIAFARAANEPLCACGDAGCKFRTWQLRAGQKYLLRVPTEKFSNVFKLPAAAVTDDGPDKVVFIEDGDSFKAAKVVILHQDHEVAILDSKSSEIFPGDSVAQHGAFGLGLALKTGSGEVDPHAGHSHD